MFYIKAICVIQSTYKEHIINDDIKFRVIKIIFVNEIILRTIFCENVFEYIETIKYIVYIIENIFIVRTILNEYYLIYYYSRAMQRD